MQVRHLNIKKLSWIEDNEIIRDIRSQVFIDEQKVPENIEWDDCDISADHFGFFQDEKFIGYARIINNKNVWIGRMLVKKNYRKHGIGSVIMDYLIKYSDLNYKKDIFVSAQIQAIPFYEKNNFQIISEKYLDANIWHRNMRLIRQVD